ncbi:BON domain-containing protein [Rhodopila sp.]|uniref:BON domain-containing protein n=1 Tax=Rhodopila sp. TaxID=2480087 RepID=UPI003D0BD8B7
MPFDKQLQQAVLAELDWEPSVVAGHIGVTADAGIVTLTGHVESFAEKYAAEKATRRVRGVKAVAEEIKVELPFERIRHDDDIAAAALERLAWDTSVPPDAITVKVEQGWITLTGQVPWYYQKQAAEQDIARLHGVSGISNHLVVKPTVDVSDISDKIRHALRRSWLVDDETVTVRADGGRVRLTGTVRSHMIARWSGRPPGLRPVRPASRMTSQSSDLRQTSDGSA